MQPLNFEPILVVFSFDAVKQKSIIAAEIVPILNSNKALATFEDKKKRPSSQAFNAVPYPGSLANFPKIKCDNYDTSIPSLYM